MVPKPFLWTRKYRRFIQCKNPNNEAWHAVRPAKYCNISQTVQCCMCGNKLNINHFRIQADRKQIPHFSKTRVSLSFVSHPIKFTQGIRTDSHEVTKAISLEQWCVMTFFQCFSLTLIHYDVQSCSPDKIFTRGIRQQEKVLVNLEHAGWWLVCKLILKYFREQVKNLAPCLMSNPL